MKHITLSPDQHIELQTIEGATLENALTEAIALAGKHPGNTFDLTYNGFLFGVEHDGDVNSLIDEYNEWVSMADEAKHQCINQ